MPGKEDFIMLREVFCKEIRKFPIPYNEFAQIGMSKNGYLLYIAQCDRLRSALILKAHSLQFYREGKAKSKLKDERGSIDKICQICFDELIDMLQTFCKDDLDITYLARKNISTDALYTMGLRYSGSTDFLFGLNDDESPFLLYSDFDRFRVFLEEVLYKLINRDFPIFTIEFEPKMEDLPLYQLKLDAERKYDYEHHDSEPDFPVDSGKSEDIFSWAEKAERYYNHQNFIFNHENIEDVIASKEKSIFDAHKHTLYIFKGSLSCKKEQHTLESTKAVVTLPDNNMHKAELDVFYCRECNKFYINETSYNLYRKKYGFLPVCFVYDSRCGLPAGYSTRAEKSPLMLCGYSVSQKSGLSKNDREKLLAWIIDHHIHGLEKFDIITHLEFLIETNGNNPNNAMAKEKWKDDLRFVHNYAIDKQPNADINNISVKRSNI